MDGEVIEIQALTRGFTAEQMYRDYKERCNAQGNKCLERSKFLNIVRALTRRESKRKPWMDYIYIDLLCDNMDSLRGIVKISTPLSLTRSMLIGVVDIEVFLKTAFGQIMSA